MTPAPVLVIRVVTRLNVGGPTRQIASLMSRLDPARFAQILISGPGEAAEGAGTLPVPGERIDLNELRRPISPLADWRAYTKLVGLFEKLRPAIVHTHQAKAGWVGRMAAAAAGVPVILHTYHGHTFRRYFAWPVAGALRSLERRAAERSSALIAQAAGQAADIETYLGAAAREKTRVIPPGIELPDPGTRPPPPAPAGPWRIVFPARLEAVKDPMLALDVLRRLPDDHELRVFGDGSLRAAVEARVRADPALARRVSIHPATADRAALFAGAHVTLLTSREEGTPLALLESQAFGIPVVAPDVGAVRSVVAEGGGFVVERNAAALAAGVLGAVRARVPESAVTWVRDQFSAELMVSRVAALYEELLSR